MTNSLGAAVLSFRISKHQNMIPDESPTIEQLVDRMSTDRVLATHIQGMLELRTEIELIQRLIIEQMTLDKTDEETKEFVKRLSERRLSLLAAMTADWRRRGE
ncbi:MAG: hypothetical protein ABI882_12780 [Acidobacteriota bacterium]